MLLPSVIGGFVGDWGSRKNVRNVLGQYKCTFPSAKCVLVLGEGVLTEVLGVINHGIRWWY
jgi:hypothetical protein